MYCFTTSFEALKPPVQEERSRGTNKRVRKKSDKEPEKENQKKKTSQKEPEKENQQKENQQKKSVQERETGVQWVHPHLPRSNLL